MSTALAIFLSLALLIPQPEELTILSNAADLLRAACAADDYDVSSQRIEIETNPHELTGGVITIVLHQSGSGSELRTGVSLPEVRFFHEPGILRGERRGARNHAVVFERLTDQAFIDAFSEVAPLWPMPHKWEPDEEGSVLDPALGAIDFSRVERIGNNFILHGTSPTGAVTLRMDRSTHRIEEISAVLSDGTIRCTYAPLAPMPIETWRIDVDGRWVVRRLDQLSLAGPPIEAGVTLPNLTLLSPEYVGVSLDEIQSAEQVRLTGPWALLLILRADAEQATFDLAGEVARRAWSVAAEEIASLDASDHGQYWLGHRAIVVAVTQDLDILPGRIREIADRSPRGVPTLISTEPEMTLDRVEDSYALTAVIVDPNRTVGGVVTIENAETGVSAILEIMRSYTRPAPQDEGEMPAVASEAPGE